MSWRAAAELAREWAQKARRQADEQPSDQARIEKYREAAYQLERFANECMHRSGREDITVIEPGRPRKG